MVLGSPDHQDGASVTRTVVLCDGSEWAHDGSRWTHVHPDTAGKRLTTGNLPFVLRPKTRQHPWESDTESCPLTASDHRKIADVLDGRE